MLSNINCIRYCVCGGGVGVGQVRKTSLDLRAHVQFTSNKINSGSDI